VVARRVRLGRDVLPVLAIGLLVCHLVRTHALEWYLVPTSSMEPTLHGDPERGDLVLVNKTAYWSQRPERFDLVVLRHRDEDESGLLVKRFIASGDDPVSVVRIDGGDVFLGSSRQDLQRWVKDPAEARDLRLTHFQFPEIGAVSVRDYFQADPVWSTSVDSDGSKVITLAAGASELVDLAAQLSEVRQHERRAASPPDLYLPGHLSTRYPVTTTFLDCDGRQWGGQDLYRDIGIEIEATASARCRGIQLVLEHLGRYLALEWQENGDVVFLVGDHRIEPTVHAEIPSAGDRRFSLAYGYLDGRLFLEIDGQIVFCRAYDLPEEPDREPALPGPEVHNLLHLAVAGGSLRIHRLRVFHDVYYKSMRAPFAPMPPPVELQPGELFLLGDNTFDSRDSRTGRRFASADLVGRPLAILGPGQRRRWLIR
jgi:signal peptidase I